VPHTPHAVTAIRASSRPGGFVSASASSKGPFGDWMWTALCVDIRFPHQF
jgi:hypothetical protein